MKCDDIATIHAKLKEEGLCSPKMLIDCAGWGRDEDPEQRLALVMDYLEGIGVAKRAPEGYVALDVHGNPLRRRTTTPLPKVKHPEVTEKTEAKMPRKSSYDSMKASKILASIRGGDPIARACEKEGVTESMFKRWRSANQILNTEAREAARMAGNKPSERAQRKHSQILELLGKGHGCIEVSKMLKCSMRTIRQARGGKP